MSTCSIFRMPESAAHTANKGRKGGKTGKPMAPIYCRHCGALIEKPRSNQIYCSELKTGRTCKNAYRKTKDRNKIINRHLKWLNEDLRERKMEAYGNPTR